MRGKYVIPIILFLFAGCSYYSVSGSLPGHIKTAAVPLFENETTETQLVEDVTESVVDAIIANGAMKVVSEFQADAVVNGTIIDVIDEADEYSRDEVAAQFRIRIIAHVSFYDRVKNRVIWEEERLEGWARYEASGSAVSEDSVSREEGKKKALDMLAKEIIDKTVAGW